MPKFKKRRNFLFICKDPNSLINFRGELIVGLQKKGFHVSAICNDMLDKKISDRLHSKNIDIFSVKYQSQNPFKIFYSIYLISRKIKMIDPEIILSYTLVATAIGSIASKIARHKNFNSLITGRGILFTTSTLFEKIRKITLTIVLRLIYPLNNKVIFQNKDDAKLFSDLHIISTQKSYVVSGGSGVDMEYFRPLPLPNELIFLTVGRLLKHKGLLEFAMAGNKLKQYYPTARFLIAGKPDNGPDKISIKEIQDEWPRKYGTEYLGYFEDIRDAIKQCSIFVLLSHHEGVPRASIEAMSMGRPIITTDAPGCNETIVDGKNGLMVQSKNYESAFSAMKQLAESSQLNLMGRNSIDICKLKFDVKLVNDRMFKILEIF
jgi:glycosyltransferase involved in cell wall biosynthesis